MHIELLEEEEEEEEEKEKVHRGGDDKEEEGDRDGEDEDFDYEDEDDEFFPEEDDYSDEEEDMRGKKKNNDGMKMVKKVFQKKRSSLVSTRGRKSQSSRASKKPLRKKRKNGRLRKKVRCADEDEDDFIDNSPTTRTSRKKRGQKRKRVLLSDSEYPSSGSSDFEFTISEEEREQVREAKKLCGNLRNNLRSASQLINNEEVGVHEEQIQLRKPPARKGKEKIEEPQGRKGKEKVEVKSEMGKQVCGICLSEEDKRRVRGVLNCCTHFFCFACIMEWAKVESRCPLCKQRFKTISKPARSTTGIDLREVVIQVPERDQVYQPSEEELRSYIDPYESVICSECNQGGDDGLMLLCDICDSPAHTYCVGLGREVPEGNWYCDGCRPVALGSSSSQVQEGVADPRLTIQNLPVRAPPALHVRESIDLNLISSPRAAINQGFVHLPSSRFSSRSVEGSSPVSGGAPTLSERRWIHRQIQQLLSIDRMTATPGRTTNGISATSSTSNLYSSQIDQSRGTATLHVRTQDVGTSYHTFFDDRLCNNTSPVMQNGPLWPGLMATPPVPDCEQVHQFSRSNIVPDDGLSTAVREETNFHTAKEQLQSMVKSHLKSLSQNVDLGHSTFKDIARSSMHTILAACDLEHKNNEVCNVPPPSACPHMELMAGGPTSLIKGCCSSCFDSFVGDVVKPQLNFSCCIFHFLGLVISQGEKDKRVMAGGGAPAKSDEPQPHPPKDQLPNISYCITSPPPWPEAILLGFQHFLVMLGTTVLIPTALVPQMGGGNNEKARVIETLLFVAGINTLLQTLFGTRLPAVIGGSYTFVPTTISIILAGRFSGEPDPIEKFKRIMRSIQGALIVASTLQIVLGFSGLWRNVARFLSPLSSVPLVSLVGFGLYELGFPGVAKCVEIGLPQLILIVFVSQYVPHVLHSGKNIFDRFAVIFTVVIVWIYAHLLTVGGAYNDAPPKTQISCRTDRAGLIDSAPWIRIPYPFQWGAPSFDAGEAFAMMMAAFVALVESSGAFIAVYRYASATPLPPSILSRGIGWQGVGILLSGLFGTVNGSSVSVENAGLLALTRVGSRRVVQISAGFMIFFSILGKFGAVFASIPPAIIAALYCLFFAYVGAGGLSFLQFCNLNSFRTKFILGFSIFLGLSVPQYFNEYTAINGYGPVNTGARWFNDIINVPFQSKPFVAGVVAYFLDNTLFKREGSIRKDRGKHWWDKYKSFKGDTRSEEFYSLPFNLNKYFPSV